MKFVGLTVATVGAVLLAAGAASASSVDVTFSRVTPANSPLNPAAQLHCTVSDVAGHSDQVTMHFSNNVGIASSIMEIYFDDRTPLSLLSINGIGQSGATFATGNASPGNLPGGANLTPAFNANSSFSADAGSGGPTQGLDAAADYLDMTFNLQTGNTFGTVLTALQTGTLRIGLHVIAIGGSDGQSDSFVNNAVIAPVPQAAALGGAMLAGLLGIGAIRRTRSTC